MALGRIQKAHHALIAREQPRHPRAVVGLTEEQIARCVHHVRELRTEVGVVYDPIRDELFTAFVALALS